jgi:hypothetical protein
MATNWYYNAQNDYGNQAQNNPWGDDFADTEVGNLYLQQNPNFAYVRYLGQLGADDDDSPYARWLRGQYARTQQGWGAAFARNPLLSYHADYLPSLGNADAWRQRFQSLTPGQRGEENAPFAPVTRTLRWL